MRAPSWIRGKRIKIHNPPLVRAQNVYDLAGAHVGETVIVAAPGPSFASFPREVLLRHTSIGVNAALELYDPTYWLFCEPFFTREYRPLYMDEGRCRRIVTTRFQALAALELLLPATKSLWWFRYGHAPKHDPEDVFSVLKMQRPTDGRRPWWSVPDKGFLPGRCSVATHAVSLAILMGAKMIVTIGVDFKFEDENYYAPGVKINPGPGKGVAKGLALGKRRTKALACGRNWAILAAKKGVWEGSEILSISPAGGLPGARRVSVDEAVARIREVNA